MSGFFFSKMVGSEDLVDVVDTCTQKRIDGIRVVIIDLGRLLAPEMLRGPRSSTAGYLACETCGLCRG